MTASPATVRRPTELRVALVAVMMWLLLVLGGCGDSMGGGSGVTPSAGSASSVAADIGFNDADVHFVQAMAPHHDQAVEMSTLVLSKSKLNPDVRKLAEQIKAAQQSEIDTMNVWLDGWAGVRDPHEGEPVETGPGHHGGAGGLMTEEQMRQLDRATGGTAQRLFLEGMIRHHQGAVVMAGIEIKDGIHIDAVPFARHIVENQNAQIAVMQDLLARL